MKQKSENSLSLHFTMEATGVYYEGLERSPAEWKPLSKNFRILRQLTRERYTLIQTRTQTMNHLHAYKYQGRPQESSIERCKQVITVINHQVDSIEKEIKTVVDCDEVLKERLGYVLSIKGVGFLSAVCIISETNGFASFRNIKQLTSKESRKSVKREINTSIEPCISPHFPKLSTTPARGNNTTV
jgi:transposase